MIQHASLQRLLASTPSTLLRGCLRMRDSNMCVGYVAIRPSLLVLPFLAILFVFLGKYPHSAQVIQLGVAFWRGLTQRLVAHMPDPLLLAQHFYNAAVRSVVADFGAMIPIF